MRRSLALAIIVILALAIGAVAFGFSGGGRITSTSESVGGKSSSITSQTETSATSSTTSTALSTISISNSTALSGLEIAATNVGGDLYDPVLDSNTGLIYALSFSQDYSNTLLTAINTSSLAAKTVLTLPATGLGIAVDVKTNMVYVSILGCEEGAQAPNSCSSNPSGFYDQEILRVNGSTGIIEGQTPIQTNESSIGVDPNTDTLYAIQSCPHVNPSSPCGRLLAFNATTGSLAQNLTVKAFLDGLVVNPVTGMVYSQGIWDLPASRSSDNRTSGIVAFTYPPPSIQVAFDVPLNYTNTIDLSVDAGTNVVYGFADNIAGNETSANLVAMNGATGSVLSSNVVGTACSVADSQGNSAATPEGATVNTSTNQVYLDTILGESTLVVLDGTTGQVVGMLPLPSPIDNSLFDGQGARLFVFLEGGGVAAIPSAVMEGGVDLALLNIGCPVGAPAG